MKKFLKLSLLKNKKVVATIPPVVGPRHHIYEKYLRWAVTIPVPATVVENSKNAAAALKSGSDHCLEAIREEVGLLKDR